MPGQPMTEEQKQKKIEREQQRQNSIPEVTPQILSRTLNRLLFLRMSYFKWMNIFIKWNKLHQ